MKRGRIIAFITAALMVFALVIAFAAPTVIPDVLATYVDPDTGVPTLTQPTLTPEQVAQVRDTVGVSVGNATFNTHAIAIGTVQVDEATAQTFQGMLFSIITNQAQQGVVDGAQLVRVFRLNPSNRVDGNISVTVAVPGVREGGRYLVIYNYNNEWHFIPITGGVGNITVTLPGINSIFGLARLTGPIVPIPPTSPETGQ